MKIRKIKSKNHRKATQTKWITQKAKARASERDFFWVCVCAYVCVHFKRQKFMYLCVCVSHSNSSLLSLTFAASVYRSCVNTNSHKNRNALTHTYKQTHRKTISQNDKVTSKCKSKSERERVRKTAARGKRVSSAQPKRTVYNSNQPIPLNNAHTHDAFNTAVAATCLRFVGTAAKRFRIDAWYGKFRVTRAYRVRHNQISQMIAGVCWCECFVVMVVHVWRQ